MTEMELHQGEQAEVAPVVTELPALAVWANEARQVAVIAESLARTAFVPAPFRGKPAEVTAAILAGQEVGMRPMAALRAIDVIQGKPAMSALAMRALVQSHGHRITVTDQSNTRAVVEGQRRGDETVQRSVWTIERAKQLGIAGKDNWRNQPMAMLVARATAECARLVAADVILGMPYSTEELEDVDAAPAPTKRTAKRKPVEKPTLPEPELDEPAEPVTDQSTDGGDWPEPATPGGES